MPKAELYIGNLDRDITRKDIEDAFDKYGRLLRCEVKNRGTSRTGFGPVYAFLEFEDERDAEDALKAENGKDLLGSSMIVEFAKSKDRRDRRGGGPRSLDCYECGERGHFARECRARRGGGGGSGGRRDYRDRSRDRSRDRYRDRSRDRSRDRYRDSSRDRSRERRSDRRDRHRDRSREKRHSRSVSYHSRSGSRSRSPSYDKARRDHS